MPAIDDADYILSLLIEAGISESNGMGLTPLSWTELANWTYLSKIDINSWEASTIISLSRQFTASLNEYDDKDIPPPFTIEDFDREKVSQSIGDRLRSLAKRINKNG